MTAADLPTIALQLDIPPTFVWAGGHPPTTTVLPPITVTIGMSTAFSLGKLYLSTPEDDTTVPTSTPTLTVGLTALDETEIYTIEVQYADDSVFTNPVTLSASTTGVDGGVSVLPSAAVPDTTFWRARLLLDGDEQIPWTAAASFTVSQGVGVSTLPVTWSVVTSGGVERPIHLWHFYPPGAEVGDVVTVYGQGFPSSDASGRITIDGIPIPVTSWSRVPAVAGNTTTARAINGDTVTCEHYEVVFVAPDIEDGGVIAVEATA